MMQNTEKEAKRFLLLPKNTSDAVLFLLEINLFTHKKIILVFSCVTSSRDFYSILQNGTLPNPSVHSLGLNFQYLIFTITLDAELKQRGSR